MREKPGSIEIDPSQLSPSLEVIIYKKIPFDIKSGNYPNSINVNSAGVAPVAVLPTDVFDASMVDPDTISFLGASPFMKAKLEDVDHDGDMDMIVHFKTQELDFSLVVDEGDEYPLFISQEIHMMDYHSFVKIQFES